MTESESMRGDDFPLVFSKKLENIAIQFIKKENKTWLTSSAIANGLQIDRTNVNQIFHNNEQLLEPYSAVMKLITPQGTHQNTRVFDKTGFIGICMRSNSPKALPFQQWVLKIVDHVEKKGYYIEKTKDMNPIDWALQQIEVLHTMATAQKDQERKLESIEQDVKELQEKDKYIYITPQTRKKLRDEVHRIALEYFNGNHREIWAPLKRKYGINSYHELTEEDAQYELKRLENKCPKKF